MQSLESRLTACVAAIVSGVGLAALAVFQIPRPDTWFVLAIASITILLGTVGVLFFERAPYASLWAGLGAVLVLSAGSIPLLWVVALSRGGSDIPATLFGGAHGGFASPFGEGRFGDLASNSAIAAVIATALGIVIGGAVAYPLSRGRMRGRTAARTFVWASVFVPVVALVGPWSVGLIDAGLLDSAFALATSSLILTVPICAAGLLFLGDRLDPSAARLAIAEGATPIQRFRKVTLPVVGPGVCGVAAVAFLAVWNDLVVAASVSVWETATVGMWVRTLPGPVEQSGLMLVWLAPAFLALVVAVRAADSVLDKERCR